MRKNKKPLISIVMLNHNGFEYLKETIPSVLNLKYPNYEFIVVDNGSKDRSLQFVGRFKKIKLIRSPVERAKNYACNYAVSFAKGEFILLLDNDLKIINKYLLEDLLDLYYSLPKVGSIGLSCRNKGEFCSKNYGGYLCYYYIKEIPYLPLKVVKKLNGTMISFPDGKGVFLKKRLWEKVGGYDDFLVFGGDDNDLGAKIWMMGYKNYLYSKTIQVHLGLPERQDNQKYSLKLKEMFYAHLYTIVKNYSSLNMIITLIGFSVFAFLKAMRQSIRRLYFGPLVSFFLGYYLFLKNFKVALLKRRIVQSKRIVKEDIFLKVRPPKVK